MPNGRCLSRLVGATLVLATASSLSAQIVNDGDVAWGFLNGTRSVVGGGLVGSGAYAASATSPDGFVLGWNVTYNGATQDYTYLYTFSGFDGRGSGLGHVIFELTADCETDPTCVTGSTLTPLFATYSATSQGASNVGLPTAMYGVKFNMPENTTAPYSLSFTSTHAPVWGDFYAKAGQGYAYNANQALASGDLSGYIVRPDGVFAPPTTATPEPATVSLMASGLLALGVAARRLRRTT